MVNLENFQSWLVRFHKLCYHARQTHYMGIVSGMCYAGGISLAIQGLMFIGLLLASAGFALALYRANHEVKVCSQLADECG